MEKPICPECGCEFDPDWCWCGEAIDGHRQLTDHQPVPAGCECGFVKIKEKEEDTIDKS